GFIDLQVVQNDGEFFRVFIITHPANCGIEPDVFAGVAFFNPAFYIIEKYGSWRIGGYWFLKMIIKRIIGKFKTFLRPVRPQIFVHTSVNGFAVFSYPGSPGIVPHAAPVALFFKTNDLGYVFSAFFQRFESTDLCQSAGSCTNNTNTFVL